jgi:hypothetical protein
VNVIASEGVDATPMRPFTSNAATRARSVSPIWPETRVERVATRSSSTYALPFRETWTAYPETGPVAADQERPADVPTTLTAAAASGASQASSAQALAAMTEARRISNLQGPQHNRSRFAFCR